MATKTATVQSGQVSGASHTDFPAYVDLADVGVTTLAEAESIRVYSDSGLTTELAREIVSVTEMHVKIPSMTSSTQIWVDYDGIRSDYAVGATYGRNAVWGDYEVVYHMQQPSGSQVDSTGNGGDLSVQDSDPLESVSGQIGDSVDFDGNDSYIQTAVPCEGLPAITVQLWMYPDLSTTRSPIQQGNVWDGFYNLAWNVDVSSLNPGFGVYKNLGSGAGDRGSVSSTTNLTLNSWNLLHATWDGSGNFKIYQGGSLTASATNAAIDSMTTASANLLRVGRSFNTFGHSFWRGKLDEIRVRDTALSADWVSTEKNNQNDNAAFWGTWTTAGGFAGFPIIHHMQTSAM